MNKQRNLRKPSLLETHPALADQFHPTANPGITLATISGSYTGQVIWLCEKGHEWSLTPRARTKVRDSNCPKCISLFYSHPEIAVQWHPTKNGKKTPLDVTSGSNVVIWWKCDLGEDHEWEQPVKTRVLAIKETRNKASACQVCTKLVATASNCLAITHPAIASEWDYQANKNLGINPTTITEVSRCRVNWKCRKGHTWQGVVRDRTQKNTECACCIGRKPSDDNNLAVTHPELVQQWHPAKNDTLKPEDFTKGSEVKIWWQCPISENHVWDAYIYSRTAGRNCPNCSYWSIESVRLFVLSLLPYQHTLDPAERYVIFQQNGLLSSISKSRSFIKNFLLDKFPQDILAEIVEDSDKFAKFIENQIDESGDDVDALRMISEADLELQIDEKDFPIVETKDILAAVESKIIASADAETINFLVKSAVAKIWRHAFYNEQKAFQQLELYHADGEYAQEVKKLFTDGYNGAKNLMIPEGYNPEPPSFLPKKEGLGLMQRYVAYQIKTQRRFGNWSGTGAGKTLSAILASRVMGAKLTVICCPNNVIDTWKKQIKGSYPSSVIYTKESLAREIVQDNMHKYLILNYEFFQQPASEAKLKTLVEDCAIDLIVIDEIHYSKQRVATTASKRKTLVSAFLSEASVKNQKLCILGMSATPVINDLYEGKSLIELITGVTHDELNTRPTLSNCIDLYKKFVSHGVRYLPNYSMQFSQKVEHVDCSAFVPKIKNHKTHVELEAILTRAKLPFILDQLQRKTIVYTHYRVEIEHLLQKEIRQKGWTVALFNGTTKEGLEQFLKGEVDILIATTVITTGIDGLQKVCNRLIINCLPWTHAEFKQLVGRIYRQGQIKDRVDVIIPLTFAEINGKHWSWCESRWKRIQYKKGIADASVDGEMLEGSLVSPAQTHKDVMKWFERLNEHGIHEVERSTISLQLTGDSKRPAIRKFADISRMNQQMNKETSQETHQRFTNNPQEWHDYHDAYSEVRKDWDVVPYQEAIKWCAARPNLIVGDFGCGHAFLAKELKNKVYSFDHIAIDASVIPCDIAHVPLEDKVLDAAIFSLSLMGQNFVNYLKEARRCLKLDGQLWIAESTARINDIGLFKELLERLGFDVRCIDNKGQFTFIQALKSERDINETVLKVLMEQVYDLTTGDL